MRRMTRTASSVGPGAPFDGRSFDFMGDRATLHASGAHRYVTLEAGGARSVFRVTKVLGGRQREDFVGVEVGSPNDFSGPLGDEQVLPVSFVRFDSSLRYKGYSVMSPERPALMPGPRWRTTCAYCHNTVPLFSSLLDELHGPGAPTFQGSASVELPPGRAARFEITDGDELRHRAADEIVRLGGEPPEEARTVQEMLAATMLATRRHFDTAHLLEIGIGCEACHGGAREHVERPGVLPSFLPRSTFFRVLNPRGDEPSDAEAQNRACARCHTVLFTRYPHTWEGGARASNPGGSNVNSGEARDLLLGGCSAAMACSTCHDPHGAADQAALDRLGTVAGNRVCTDCHSEPRFTRDLRTHTHHDPGADGSACVGCHLPKKNLGLAYDLTRYHRIGAPTDRARVEGDRPLECAVCHPDATVARTVETMERWWGKRFDRRALGALYGRDLRVNVLEATLARGKAHEQATAVGIAGAHRASFLSTGVVAQLANRYPLVRFYAKHALQQIRGEPIPVDAHLPGAELEAAVKAWLSSRR